MKSSLVRIFTLITLVAFVPLAGIQAHAAPVQTALAEAARLSEVLVGSSSSSAFVTAIKTNAAMARAAQTLIGRQFTGSRLDIMALAFQLKDDRLSDMEQAFVQNLSSIERIVGNSEWNGDLQDQIVNFQFVSMTGVQAPKSVAESSGNFSAGQAQLLKEYIQFMKKLDRIRQTEGIANSDLRAEQLKEFLTSERWARIRGPKYMDCLITDNDFNSAAVMTILNSGFAEAAKVQKGGQYDLQAVKALIDGVAAQLTGKDTQTRACSALATAACPVLLPELANASGACDPAVATSN